MASTEINVDKLLEHLKPFGRYQILQYAIMSLSNLAVAFIVLEIIFIGYHPSFHCRHFEIPTSRDEVTSSGTENGTLGTYHFGTCSVVAIVSGNGSSSENETLPCMNGYQYSIPREQTIVAEWDLVCDRNGLSELSQSLFIVGQGLGSIVFTSLADHLGRKPVHITCFIMMWVVNLVASFSPNVWVFIVLRLLVGTFQMGQSVPLFSTMVELFPTDNRTLMAGLFGVSWAVSVMLFALLAYVCRFLSWRHLSVVISSFGALSILSHWYIEESLRWLFANNKLKQAKRILKKASRQNRVNFTEIWQVHVMHHQGEAEGKPLRVDEADRGRLHQNADATSKNDDSCQNKGLLLVIRERSVRLITIILVYNWFMTSLTYYGLYMTSSTLIGDRHLNFFLITVCELPANFLVIVLLLRLGRKKTTIFFQGSAGVSLLISVAVRSTANGNATMETVSTAFSFLGMFGISGMFSTVWIYSPEIFPTNLRTAATGLFSFAARLGSMLSPFSLLLALHTSWLPGFVFGCGSLIGVFFLLFLPETLNRQLPQTLQDFQSWKQKPLP